MWHWEYSEDVVSDSFAVHFCFNSFLPLKLKNRRYPEISGRASVSNSSQYCFLLHLFSCSSVAFLFAGLSQTSSPQTSYWLQKGRDFATAESQALFCLGSLSGLQSGSWWHGAKCFWCLLLLDGLLRVLVLFFFLSAGGWVALRWVHQGSLLQPGKIWGQFKWCLSIWNVTLLYCFIRALSPHWEKQVLVLALWKKTSCPL